MHRLLTVLALTVVLAASAAPRPASADDPERAFLLCDGASRTEQGRSFAFTVTLDPAEGAVLDMGSGPGATTVAFTDTRIAARQVVGSGVLNALQIDRGTGAFTLTITHPVQDGEAPADTDDAFDGTCGATGKAF